MRTVELSDGRTLAYEDYGDPDGKPVVFTHGFGDSRLIRNPDDALTASLGVRVIAPDQPGVGGSSPKPGRRMADWGQDVEELADRLGIGEFAVAGHSGGSPHTLAIARHRPDRVPKGVLASPVGDFDDAFMRRQLVLRDLKLIARIHRLHHLLRWASRTNAKKALKDVPSYVESVAEEDRSDAATMLGDPAQRAMFEASFAAGAAHDGEGTYEMTLALWDWGFAPEDVRQPFEVFYGDADDIISPRMPVRVAAELPNGTAHVWPGAGHYGFVDRERWTEFLSAVT
ncbi:MULTISPECIES: alpha/beta fold hydrolase [unclassified Streptomyces]|uniref:alpha/beta fold hydrolase n=1 Tax=unclassified Streptomyces TaxID=2593676 RepID=UPI001F0413B6|nr:MULTISPECIES: alpha/beta hydrolase [unclassified Streptomyces]MCH0566805.1 alpha/beta hydrolase [Streptomyces sp. MUM 2J]MCH0572324.1 alpha/beta hydrolase [Streptomyces sp. MUM 136J]